MKWKYDDGGRQAAGFKGDAGDCGVRAIAIATGCNYQQVYEEINEICKLRKPRKRERGKSSSRTGLHIPVMKQYMKTLGWIWTPTMFIGSGCRVHLRADELPSGRLVLNLSKHYAAFLDGVLHDTHDCSRDGTRCVYGYWKK
jgi:hypothetical protein